MIRAAVLTISDSAHAGSRTDLSGPAVKRRLKEAGWQVAALEVLPDEAAVIAARLAALADDGETGKSPPVKKQDAFAGSLTQTLQYLHVFHSPAHLPG